MYLGFSLNAGGDWNILTQPNIGKRGRKEDKEGIPFIVCSSTCLQARQSTNTIHAMKRTSQARSACGVISYTVVSCSDADAGSFCWAVHSQASDDDVFYLFLQKQRIEAKLHIYL